MNVGYGCNIFYMQTLEFAKFPHRNGLVPLFPLGAIIILNAPLFLLLKKVL